MSTTVEWNVWPPNILRLDMEPIFSVRKSIPSGFAPILEVAVKDFIVSSHVPEGIDIQGFYNQTLSAIASSTVLGQGGEFWMGTKNDELLIYVLANFGNDLDGRLSYNISQCWVRKDYRGNPIVKKWWEAIRQRAKDFLCKHIVITSSRNPEAYMRWLGGGLHHYVTLLKQEI